MASDWNLLTTEAAAKQLDVSTDAIRRYFASGILAGRRHGRMILVEQRAVLALRKVVEMARTGVKPTPPVRAPGRADQVEPELPFEESENEGCEMSIPDSENALSRDVAGNP